MLALIAFSALALGPVQAPAKLRTSPRDSAAPPVAQTQGPPGQAAPSPHDTAQLSRDIAQRRAAGEKYLPDADHFTWGSRTIAANTVVDGPIAVANGDLDVFGTVAGDVVSLNGNVRIHKGARVTGNAWAASGTVVIDGGLVEGEQRVVNAPNPVVAAETAPIVERRPLSTVESVKLVLGWFALLAIIGIGVMVFAEPNLDGVVLGLERGFARAFWLGVAGQVVLLPVLVVVVVALAITLIGVLLIPFAIVAYVIAAAGLFTLGFLAVARLVGGGLASDRGTASPRGVRLRALMIGLIVFLGMWMITALFAWSPLAGSLFRAIAIAVTWVAATVGLGAAITSRAGTHRPGSGTHVSAPADDLAWQTPTPVTGVAASRRSVS